MHADTIRDTNWYAAGTPARALADEKRGLPSTLTHSIERESHGFTRLAAESPPNRGKIATSAVLSQEPIPGAHDANPFVASRAGGRRTVGLQPSRARPSASAHRRRPRRPVGDRSRDPDPDPRLATDPARPAASWVEPSQERLSER